MCSLLPKSHKITADDWGISPSVNEGILSLAQSGIVSRISILADSQFVLHKIDELIFLKNQGGLDIGLHFNLTHEHHVSSGIINFLFKWLVARPFMSRKNKNILNQTIQRELFKQYFILKKIGLEPTYFDSHHHVHLAPGILNTIGSSLVDLGLTEIRLAYSPQLWLSPKALVNIFSLIAKPEFKKFNFKPLPFYYPKASVFRNPHQLQKILAQHKNFEILVHPEMAKTGSRAQEYHALKSLEL